MAHVAAKVRFVKLRFAAEFFNQLKGLFAVPNVETRMDGQAVLKVYRVVDDVESILHHVKCAMQRIAAVEEIQLFDAGSLVRDAVGADVPGKDLRVKGHGPLNVDDRDGEPTHLTVTFLLVR